jgi:transcriptional regulator with XRE-family HTH domain
MLSKAFGQRLKATREERGMTQRELARRIETQVPQISRYENGVYLPNAETLVQIAAVLKTGIDTLLLGKELPDTGDQPLKNIVLLERLAEIDQLPREDQEMVVRLIEAVIKSRQGERVFAPARRSA